MDGDVPLNSLSMFSIKTQKMDTDGGLGRKSRILLVCLNDLFLSWCIIGVELTVGFLVQKKSWPHERRNQVCRKEM